MEQLELFQNHQMPQLATYIKRDGPFLIIPEGLHTIPCTHGLHRFAGKFIPNLPRYFIREFIPNDPERVLLDPYCGSGTTLVEAALEGKRFLGLDIDPLSVAISKAKINSLTSDEIVYIEKYWLNHDFSVFRSDVIPDIPNFGHWFTDEAIKQLSSIKYRCLQLPSKVRLFCLIVFSSIIRRVSNADDQSQKTYVSHTLEKTPPLPSDIFPVFLSRALKGMKEYVSSIPSQPSGDIMQGDAIIDIGFLNFHDVITSPPYIDSIDYVYNQMLEYFWLLDELGLKTYDDYRTMRKQPMGFRAYNEDEIVKTLCSSLNGMGEIFEQINNGIGEKSPKEEIAVRSFFFDYSNHVTAVRKMQPDDGIYICVVGNSLIRGITVPTSELIEQVHLNSGYELVDKMTYEIRRHYMKFPRRKNSGKIKQDHILVFRAA